MRLLLRDECQQARAGARDADLFSGPSFTGAILSIVHESFGEKCTMPFRISNELFPMTTCRCQPSGLVLSVVFPHVSQVSCTSGRIGMQFHHDPFMTSVRADGTRARTVDIHSIVRVPSGTRSSIPGSGWASTPRHKHRANLTLSPGGHQRVQGHHETDRGFPVESPKPNGLVRLVFGAPVAFERRAAEELSQSAQGLLLHLYGLDLGSRDLWLKTKGPFPFKKTSSPINVLSGEWFHPLIIAENC